MFKIFLKRLYRLFLCFIKIDLFRFFHYHTLNKGSVDYIVWIYPFSLKYLFTTSIIWDLAAINSLISNRKRFSLFLGPGIGKVSGKQIIFTIHSHYNIYRFSNYVGSLHFILSELSKSNKLIPNYHEALFWENKAYMHDQFEILNIPTPETSIVKIRDLESCINTLNEDFIIKEIHSYESRGLYFVKDGNDLKNIKKEILKKYNSNDLVLVQEKIEMRRDLRVIIVHGKILHFYWRINLSNKWRPTATSKGNRVDFMNFPLIHSDTIISYAKKLNLSTCAFDITWRNDDITSTPIVLEVSPVFSPNPTVFNESYLNHYGDFKKRLQLFGYDFLYVNQIFDIKSAHISHYLS